VNGSIPTASAAGAISAFVALVLIGLVIAVPIWIASRRSKRNAAQLEAEGIIPADADPSPAAEVEPNVGALILAAVAAGLAVVSAFLPALESSAFSVIEKNTLIQSGGGFLILGCAVGIFGAAYRVYQQRTTSWAVFILGVIILGTAIYSGTGSRTKLESVLSVGGQSLSVKGSPAVGLYAAGAAGLMAMFAGVMLAGHVVSSFDAGSSKPTKTCPDCAETVLDAARVCKHCGHQFAAPARTGT
jgi:cbb3-type cytochrome oxidase subunit 3